MFILDVVSIGAEEPLALVLCIFIKVKSADSPCRRQSTQTSLCNPRYTMENHVVFSYSTLGIETERVNNMFILYLFRQYLLHSARYSI